MSHFKATTCEHIGVHYSHKCSCKNSSLDMYKISKLIFYEISFFLSFTTSGHLQLVVCCYVDFQLLCRLQLKISCNCFTVSFDIGFEYFYMNIQIIVFLIFIIGKRSLVRLHYYKFCLLQLVTMQLACNQLSFATINLVVYNFLVIQLCVQLTCI